MSQRGSGANPTFAPPTGRFPGTKRRLAGGRARPSAFRARSPIRARARRAHHRARSATTCRARSRPSSTPSRCCTLRKRGPSASVSRCAIPADGSSNNTTDGSSASRHPSSTIRRVPVDRSPVSLCCHGVETEQLEELVHAHGDRFLRFGGCRKAQRRGDRVAAPEVSLERHGDRFADGQRRVEHRLLERTSEADDRAAVRRAFGDVLVAEHAPGPRPVRGTR